MPYNSFTEAQTMQYLKKLGFDEKPLVSLDTLVLLLSRHQQSIPFENLDCMAQKKLSLYPDALAAKIVEKTRGGIGLETNSAFFFLLKALGFNVISIAAKLFDLDGTFKPELHRISCVEIDGEKYICDTGLYCEVARVPLLLKCGTEQNDGENLYRFTTGTEYTILEKKETFFWTPLYAFNFEAVSENTFETALKYCTEDDASAYNKANKISIHTHSSFAYIAGDTLRYRKNGRVIKQLCIEDRRQMNKLLDAVFHINFGEVKYVFSENTKPKEEEKMSKAILGFIGTGVMGGSMAGHLLDAGYEVHVYNRTKARADKLVERGTIWEDSPADIAKKADFVFSIVGYPKDVEEVYLGENGIVANAKEGAVLVEMTTSSPKLAQKIYEAAKEKGLGALDAPVTGGDRGAREATLSILVGGDKEDFEKALPFFEIMGKNIKHMGKAGAGQYTKLVNQILITGTMTGMCEGLAFAKAQGLDQAAVIEAISGGAAGSWSFSNYGPRILKGDYEPGFFVKHYIKDMKLAREAAKEIGIELPALDLTLDLYEKLAGKGFEDKGTQALYKLYE